MSTVDLCVVGGGPAGLGVALAARRAGLSCAVLERGTVANHLRQFPAGMNFLGSSGTMELDGLPCDSRTVHPCREEVVSYYQRVVRLAKLDVRTGWTAEAVRGADGAFEVTARDRGGHSVSVGARKVVIAAGVFGAPRRLEGVPGLELEKVRSGYKDVLEYVGRDVLVVGAGNGAAEAAFRLAHAGARVTVLDRNESIPPIRWRWHLRDLKALVAAERVRVLHRARLREVLPDAVLVETPNGTARFPNDDVLLQLGYQPEDGLLRSAGVRLGEDHVPEVDPRTLHSNVPGLYLAGAALGGTCSDRVFIWSGRNHGRVIVGHLRGEPPLVEDQGLRTYRHWAQFGTLDVPADPVLARELVPVLTGELRDDLVDVYVSRPSRPSTFSEIPSAEIGAVVEALEGWLVKTAPDGSAELKGARLPAAAMEIVKRCDGTRRIRDIAAALAQEYDQTEAELEAMVVGIVFPLLRTGRLIWRAEPGVIPA